MLIVNFGQVVDLEAGGQFAHQFTVQLLDGRRATVTTDERTVQQLIELVSGVETETARPGSNGQKYEDTDYAVPGGVHGQYDDPDEGVEFGGDYDPGEDLHERVPVMGTVAEERVVAPLQQRGGGLGQAGPVPVERPQAPVARPQRRPNVDADGFLVPPRAKTVPSDSAGYPVAAQTKAPQTSVGHLGKFAEDDDDGTQI